MTDAQPDEAVGLVRVDGARVRITVNDPVQRDAVVERLGYFDIEPLDMRGAPAIKESPHQLVRASEMTCSQFRRLIRLHDLGVAPPMRPELISYMRERVAFETAWAAEHPSEYRIITLTGALGPDTWSRLQSEFSRYDGQPVSMKVIESFQNAAVEANRTTGV